jgi:hypothetical protein
MLKLVFGLLVALLKVLGCLAILLLGDTGVGMADGKLMVSSCAEKEVLVGSFAADWVVAVDVAVVVEAAPDRYAAGRMENVEGVPGLE